MRLRERGKVSDGPGDHVAIAMQVAVTACGGAQHFGDIARDGRLFCNYGDYS